MYKIFFGNRVLILSNKVNQFTKYNGLYYQYDSKKELKKLLVSFTSGISHVPALFIEAEDIDVVFQDIKQMYQYILAAGGVVRSSDGGVLCIYRLGKWDLPKGKMEPGEEPVETAVREVEEECNLCGLEIINSLPSTYHVYEKNGVQFLKRTFWFEMLTENFQEMAPQSEESITEVCLFKKDELSVVMENTYASIRDLLEQMVPS